MALLHNSQNITEPTPVNLEYIIHHIFGEILYTTLQDDL